MKNIRWIILAALVMAAPTVSHAQAPAAAAGGGTATAGAADAGNVSNTSTDSTTTSTRTTTTSAAGIAPDDGTMVAGDTTGTTQLANTGGEPILMSLFGFSLALGAFALRRRVTN